MSFCNQCASEDKIKIEQKIVEGTCPKGYICLPLFRLSESEPSDKFADAGKHLATNELTTRRRPS